MADRISKSAILLVGVALFCVLAAVGAWAWLSGTGSTETDCPVEVGAAESLAQFVDRSELLPQGSVGDERRGVVEGLAGLGPIGEVEAGRFFEREQDVPALVPYDDRLMLVTAVRGKPAELSAVDVADSGAPTRWATLLRPGRSGWTTFTGGAVGPDWVSVFSGPAPALVTLDGGGEKEACLSLPIDNSGVDVTAVTDQAGEEVVVLASTSTGGSWLARLDPVDGSELASRTMKGPETWQDVKVAGDLVVGSRWVPATIGTSGAPRPGDAQAAWVAAWDLDAEPLWTYPAQGETPVAAVVLDVGEDGTSYVVAFDRGGPWLDAVSAQGERVWRSKLADGEWSGELWGDVVVVRGPDPRGGARLRAFDVTDGSARWTVRARQAPPVGEDPRSGFGTPLTDAEAWWVPAPNGLLRIDRGDDRVERVDSEARIDQILRVGDRIVVRSGEAVLVTG